MSPHPVETVSDERLAEMLGAWQADAARISADMNFHELEVVSALTELLSRRCLDTADGVEPVAWSGLMIERIIDAVLEVDRYAPKTIPMGANPPLFDGMQPDYDGPWLSRVDVAKRLRAALQSWGGK